VNRSRGVTVRLPRDLWERVQSEADRLGMPAPWLLARLVREGLPSLPERVELTRPEPGEG